MYSDEIFNLIPQPYLTLITSFLILSMTKYLFRFVLDLGEMLPEEAGAPKLNLDKFGMPKDYASYVWLLYKKSVEDESPARRAFLNNPKNPSVYFGFTLQYDER